MLRLIGPIAAEIVGKLSVETSANKGAAPRLPHCAPVWRPCYGRESHRVACGARLNGEPLSGRRQNWDATRPAATTQIARCSQAQRCAYTLLPSSRKGLRLTSVVGPPPAAPRALRGKCATPSGGRGVPKVLSLNRHCDLSTKKCVVFTANPFPLSGNGLLSTLVRGPRSLSRVLCPIRLPFRDWSGSIPVPRRTARSPPRVPSAAKASATCLECACARPTLTPRFVADPTASPALTARQNAQSLHSALASSECIAQIVICVQARSVMLRGVLSCHKIGLCQVEAQTRARIGQSAVTSLRESSGFARKWAKVRQRLRRGWA